MYQAIELSMLISFLEFIADTMNQGLDLVAFPLVLLIKVRALRSK
jgi:hypothetical protein